VRSDHPCPEGGVNVAVLALVKFANTVTISQSYFVSVYAGVRVVKFTVLVPPVVPETTGV
jgi:hypothetical protein